jgi:hypothetical protein
VLEKPFSPTLQVTFLSLYGLVGFVLSLVIHLGSFGAMVLPTSSVIFFVMHLGIFPLFFAFVLRARVWQQSADSGWFSVRSSWPSRELLAYIPWWAIILVIALFLYAFINFFLATGALSGRLAGGELSEPQGARAFSGHWMLFYGLPAVFFSFVPADAQPSRAPDRAA